MTATYRDHTDQDFLLRSSLQWLYKYCLDALGLTFEELLPSNKFKGAPHKHITPQVQMNADFYCYTLNL